MKFVLEQSYADAAARQLAGHELSYFDTRSITRPQLLSALEGADVLGFRWPLPFDLDRAFLAEAKTLKHIHKSGAGLEHAGVLDLAAIRELGILFSNNAGLNADVVAEHAVLLSLLAMRPATFAHVQAARSGDWNQSVPQGVPASRTLAGKCVGVVGLGQIGTSLVRKLRGLSVGRILGYQRHPRAELTILAGVEWTGLDELLASADLIVLCLPLSPSTTGLIDRRRVGLIRPEASIVNVGRGAVIDETALYEALRDGRIRSAGLDVLEPEPSHSPIMGLPNVIVTPHTAGTALEMQAQQVVAAVEAMADFGARRTPRRLTNPETLATPHLRADWLRTTA
jgi:D-3-phosphoglycerate dehydrogenase